VLSARPPRPEPPAAVPDAPLAAVPYAPPAAVPYAPPAAVLFDRDGTLVVDVPYCADPELVTPVPTARAALFLLRAALFLGWLPTIGDEDDDRVFGLARLLEEVEQPADLVVRVAQEARVDLGHAGEQALLVV